MRVVRVMLRLFGLPLRNVLNLFCCFQGTDGIPGTEVSFHKYFGLQNFFFAFDTLYTLDVCFAKWQARQIEKKMSLKSAHDFYFY